MRQATMSSRNLCKDGNIEQLLTLALHHEIAEVKCSRIKVEFGNLLFCLYLSAYL